MIVDEGGVDTLIGVEWVTLTGSPEDDTLIGSDGDDQLDAGLGANSVDGGGGVDRLTLPFDGASEIRFNGTLMDSSIELSIDLLYGTQTFIRIEAFQVFGGDTSDVLTGANFNDRLFGIYENDRLDGRAGDDFLEGGWGSDTLLAGDGQDELRGGEDSDLLRGQAGADILVAGPGADTLIGGGGADLILIEVLSDSQNETGVDRVVGFRGGDGDRLDLSAIDARHDTREDDAFVLVEAFTGVAGQAVISPRVNRLQTLELDVDGDALADFSLLFDGGRGIEAGLIL